MSLKTLKVTSCWLLIISVIFVGCQNTEITVKPMNYSKNDVTYNCDSYFKKDSLFKVVCYNEIRDTILEEHFINGILHGLSTKFHDNGQLMLQGNYNNGNKFGVWKKYYPSGKLNVYSYYVVNEEYDLLYEKQYTEDGEPYIARYPLDINLNKDVYSIGDTVEITFDLQHSEFTNPLLFIELEVPSENVIDTFASYSLSVPYKFITSKNGSQVIKGNFTEIDGDIGDWSGFGGNKEFNVRYDVK